MVQNERNELRASGRTQDSPDLPTSFSLEGQCSLLGHKLSQDYCFMWNLEPYVHNPMSIITEACDKAEFAHMALNKKAVNSKG